MNLTILQGDWIEQLRTLADESVQCMVTSPPYWGLRDYGVAGQLGLEKTPEEYAAKMVEGFREARRVLRADGTLWMNMGDSYNNSDKWGGGKTNTGKHTVAEDGTVPSFAVRAKKPNPSGLKPKDLVGMPWRVAFALQADGWYLRADIIWHKPNPMPESCTDRPTKAHEYIFLLTRSPRYFYDALAIKEPVTGTAHARGDGVNPKAMKVPHGWDTGPGTHGAIHRDGRHQGPSNYNGSSFTKGKTAAPRKNVSQGPRHTHTRTKQNESFSAAVNELVEIRNKRSVWTVPTFGYPEAHFATFPPDLIKPCILAGTRPGDTVLDPFGGSGTTGQVALELGRKAVLIELNPDYVKMINQRCDVTPGLHL